MFLAKHGATILLITTLQPGLHSKFQASQGYIVSPVSKKKKKKKKKKKERKKERKKGRKEEKTTTTTKPTKQTNKKPMQTQKVLIYLL
jgi:hypothetical protein